MNEKLISDLDNIIEILQEIQKGLKGETFEVDGEECIYDFHSCVETIEEVFTQMAKFNTKLMMGQFSSMASENGDTI